MTNINNIISSIGGWTTSTCAPSGVTTVVGTTTSVTIGPTPKKTRNWTGNPRGRTPERRDALMRNRISYKGFVEQAQYFRREGIQWDCLPFILNYFHNCKRQWKGYRYNSNSWYAQQSLALFLEDIKDYNKREELGLN